MLVDVTALLSSANPNSVAEAFSVLASAPRTAVVQTVVLPVAQQEFHAELDRASAVVLQPAAALPVAAQPVAVEPVAASGSSTTDGTAVDPVTGPRPASIVVAQPARVPASQLPSMRGLPLLQQLGLLSRAQLVDFAAKHGDVLATLSARPQAAADVSAWWTGVPAAEQKNLLSAVPRLVGNLEGVPYSVRDRANRTSLSQAEATVRAELKAGQGRAASDELARRLHMLEQVRASLAGPSGDAARELINLDPDGDGTAVVTVGDVTTADYVGYLIPGMLSSVDTQIVKFAASAQQIVDDQNRMLRELHPADSAEPAPTAAVVAWIGYRTPDISNVGTLALAEQAQKKLTASVAGLRAGRVGHEPFISLMAHSYGSTAALLALQSGGLSVDALAIAGSPGSPAQNVSQLSVTDGNVWVGAASWDPVPATGAFGSHPTSPSYGAHRFGVDGATDPLTGRKLAAATTHIDYFVPGTESLRNIELIGIDRGDLVLRG
ncbi:alpha/beta hydrolase [Pseudolysinimonas sp.]|uniref:alpha/beta hydrolase n=1 Tax=Pseudolysinimonas sp. TaxID=2680009 RepID=UPI003F7EF129